MGQMKADAHELKVEKDHALIVLILCILGSGWGVIIAAVLSKQEDKKKNGIIWGVICLLLTEVLIGWILAIMCGLAIKKNSE